MHPSISSHFTEVENRNIHYLKAGKGETILFLHGWPTSSYLWRDIMPELSKKYQVIAIDLPGFGKSDKVLEDSYSFRFYARILDGFLGNLGIEKLNLGIHDLGGPIGLYWMVQNMEKVNRLILFNTLVYPNLSWMVKLFGAATYLPIVKNWLSSQNGIVRAMFFGVYKKKCLNRDILDNYKAPFQDENARKALLKSVQNLSIKGFHEIAEKLPDFKKPVQIIYGEKDKILPNVSQTMERVKKDLPQSNIVSIPNCGHFLQEEVSKNIVLVLNDFFE